MAYNQLENFLDNLDSSIHKHIVMFYEDPEYAKLVQIRFLNDGLTRGECSVYAAKDDDDLLFTKAEMEDYGIDVKKFSSSGRLQFYLRKPLIVDMESYRDGRAAFREEFVKQLGLQTSSKAVYPKIRGVGSIYRELFSSREDKSNKDLASSQLLVEKLFQIENNGAFNGLWMCAYGVNDIHEQIDKQWMIELLQNHDAVLFLPKFSNGVALNLK